MDRRELKRQAKAAKTEAGVYQIKNNRSGTSGAPALSTFSACTLATTLPWKSSTWPGTRRIVLCQPLAGRVRGAVKSTAPSGFVVLDKRPVLM